MRCLPRRFGLSLLALFMIGLTQWLLPVQAAGEIRIGHSGLPVPRFVALKKEKVYGRAGPGFDTDVRVIYRRADLPVKVIGETVDDVWRKVEDHMGRQVWINRSMLKNNSHVVAKAAALLHARPTVASPARAQIEPGAIAKLENCSDGWCKVKSGRYRGFIEEQVLWGSSAL